MELWDWAFGSGRNRRSSARKSRRSSRRARRRSRRTYSGSRSGLSGADNFIIDLLCFFYMAPFALLFASNRQKKIEKKAERRTQQSSSPKRVATAPRQDRSSYESRSANCQHRTDVVQPHYPHITDAELHGMTEEQLAAKKHQISHSAVLSEEQKAQDILWTAERQREAANRQIARAVAQQEKDAADAYIRQTAFDGFALPVTGRYTSDSSLLEMSERIHHAGSDRGTFLGLFEVSYLIVRADAVTIPVAVKDDDIEKSLAVDSMPDELQQSLKDYIAACGKVQGYTKRSWIDENSHTMKAAIYLNA